MIYTITTKIKGKDKTEIQRDYEIDGAIISDTEKLGEILLDMVHSSNKSYTEEMPF